MYTTSTNTNSKQVETNYHEMLFFEGEIALNPIKGWFLNQYLNNNKLLMFNDDVTIDQALLEPIIALDIDELQFQRQIRKYSMKKLFSIIKKQGFEKIREIIRNKIWEAIKGINSGICFLFNFSKHIETHRETVFNLERILNVLFKNSFGFPISCYCLYPSSLEVLDFAQLADLHTGYQTYDKTQQLKVKHSVTTNQTENNELEVFQELEIIPRNTIDSLHHIAKRSLSGDISPFYFRNGNQKVGIAKDLTSFYELLGEISLEVFCFHCYRVVIQDVSGERNNSTPRSDFALWIEYSLGDTQLAHQIYEVINKSLHNGLKTLDAASKFTKSTLRSSILGLIKNRIELLSSISLQ